MPPRKRQAILDSLSPAELELLDWDWWFWGRPDQHLPPGDWRVWVILSGRGWGKTRTGAESVRWWAADYPSHALVGRTAADVRDVMVEGPSGVLAVSPRWERPDYQPSKRRLVWPSGAVSHTYSADEPDSLRGPQHHKAWADELAAWGKPVAWDNLMLGLRLGDAPQAIVTTTPKPTALIRRLARDPRNVVTRGSTFDNAGNLSPAFLADIRAAYDGTALGQQELYGAVLDEAPGALWKRATFDAHRLSGDILVPLLGLDQARRRGILTTQVRDQELGGLRRWVDPKAQVAQGIAQAGRIVVAVDPAVSAVEGSDETGIVGFAASAAPWQVRQGYVLADRSMSGSPESWARAAVELADLLGADELVAEANQGGDLVRSVLRTIPEARNVRIRLVHASRGKRARAEPVAALYEQGRVHHVGTFDLLEDQCCTWVPGDTTESPDRLDALVWGATHAMLGTDRVMATSS